MIIEAIEYLYIHPEKPYVYKARTSQEAGRLCLMLRTLGFQCIYRGQAVFEVTL